MTDLQDQIANNTSGEYKLCLTVDSEKYLPLLQGETVFSGKLWGNLSLNLTNATNATNAKSSLFGKVNNAVIYLAIPAHSVLANTSLTSLFKGPLSKSCIDLTIEGIELSATGNLVFFPGNLRTGDNGNNVTLRIENSKLEAGENLELFGGSVNPENTVEIGINNSTLKAKRLTLFDKGVNGSSVILDLKGGSLLKTTKDELVFFAAAGAEEGVALENSNVILGITESVLEGEAGLALFDSAVKGSHVEVYIDQGRLRTNGSLALFDGALENSNVTLGIRESDLNPERKKSILRLFGGALKGCKRVVVYVDKGRLLAEGKEGKNADFALFANDVEESHVTLRIGGSKLGAKTNVKLFKGALDGSHVTLRVEDSELNSTKNLTFFEQALKGKAGSRVVLRIHNDTLAAGNSLELFSDALRDGSCVDLHIDGSSRIAAEGDLALFGGNKKKGIISSSVELDISGGHLTAGKSLVLFREPVKAGRITVSISGATLNATGPLELIAEVADSGNNTNESSHLELNIRGSELTSRGGRAALVGQLSGSNNALYVTMSDTSVSASMDADGASSSSGVDASVVAETTGSNNLLGLSNCHNNRVKAEGLTGQDARASLGWGHMGKAGEADCQNNALRQMACHNNSVEAEAGALMQSSINREAHASLAGSFEQGCSHDLAQWDLYNNTVSATVNAAVNSTVNSTVNATGVPGTDSVAGLSLASLGLIHTNTNGSEQSAQGKVEIRQIDSRNNTVEARVDTDAAHPGHKHQDKNKKEVASLALATDDPVCRYRCITRCECPCSSSNSSECHPFAEEGIASVLWRQCLVSPGGAGQDAEYCQVSNATVEQYLFEDNKLSNSENVLVIGSKNVMGRTDEDEAGEFHCGIGGDSDMEGLCPMDAALSGVTAAWHRVFYDHYCKAPSIQPGERVVFRTIFEGSQNVTNATRITPVPAQGSSGEASERSGLDLCSHPNLVCLLPGEEFHSLAPMEKGWLLVTIPPLSGRDGAAGPGLFRLLPLSRPRVSQSGPLSDPDKKDGQLYIDREGVKGETAEGLQALMAANGTLFHVWSRALVGGGQQLHWRRFTGDDEVHKGSCRLAGDKLLLVSEEDDGVSVWIRGADAMVERRLLETVDTPGQRFEPGGTQGPVVALARHGDWVYSLHDRAGEDWQLRRWNIKTGGQDPAWSQELGKSPLSADGVDPECLFLSEHTSAGASSRVLPNARGAGGHLKCPPPQESEVDEWDFIFHNGTGSLEIDLANPACSCNATSGWSLGVDMAPDPRGKVEVLPSLAESSPRLIVSDCRVYLVPHGSLPYKHSDGEGSAALAPLLPRAGGCLEWCQRPLRFAAIPGCTAMPIPEKSSDSWAAASALLLLPAAGAALAVGGGLYKYRDKYRHRCRAIAGEPEGQSAQGYPGSGECVPLDDLTWREPRRKARADRHTSERYSACPYVEPDGEDQMLASDARAQLHPDLEAQLADKIAGLAIRAQSGGSADSYVLPDQVLIDAGLLCVADGARRSHSGGSSSGARTPRLICAGDDARRSHSGGSSSGARTPWLLSAADGARRSHSGGSSSGARTPWLLSAADGARRSHSGGSSSGALAPRLSAAGDARRSHSGGSSSGARTPRQLSAADGARRSHSGGSASGARTPRLVFADD